MSWVEVDEVGWRWVHGLVIPRYYKACFNKIDLLNKLLF